MIERFEVLFMAEAHDFLAKLDVKARNKIIFNIDKARINNDKELFKKLTNDIWEFRTFFNKKHYRMFAFWDKSDNNETLVIATHGILKKTDKTPAQEIEKAEKLRILYLKQKIKNNENQ